MASGNDVHITDDPTPAPAPMPTPAASKDFTPDKVKALFDTIKADLAKVEGIAILIPNYGPQIVGYAKIVDNVIATVEPFVEQQWFSDLANTLEAFVQNKLSPAKFEQAVKAFVNVAK